MLPLMSFLLPSTPALTADINIAEFVQFCRGEKNSIHRNKNQTTFRK